MQGNRPKLQLTVKSNGIAHMLIFDKMPSMEQITGAIRQALDSQTGPPTERSEKNQCPDGFKL